MKLIREDYDDWYYESSTKLDTGQIATIRFYNKGSHCDKKNNRDIYIICTTYAIGSGKQVSKWHDGYENNLELSQSGKSGLKGILFALSQIKEIIALFERQRPNDKLILEVLWTDNKRRDMYFRGLSPLGFKYNNLYGYKALYYITK